VLGAVTIESRDHHSIFGLWLKQSQARLKQDYYCTVADKKQEQIPKQLPK
jgi:hypothetical protein